MYLSPSSLSLSIYLSSPSLSLLLVSHHSLSLLIHTPQSLPPPPLPCITCHQTEPNRTPSPDQLSLSGLLLIQPRSNTLFFRKCANGLPLQSRFLPFSILRPRLLKVLFIALVVKVDIHLHIHFKNTLSERLYSGVPMAVCIARQGTIHIRK